MLISINMPLEDYKCINHLIVIHVIADDDKILITYMKRVCLLMLNNMNKCFLEGP